jgi:hypothetical protein
MKKNVLYLSILLLFAFCFSNAGLTQELPYENGSIWDLSFVKTKDGKDMDYLKNLTKNYKTMMEEAKKEGLILSYKIIYSTPVNKDDWDLLLMTEFKNYAALDGLDEKLYSLATKLFGTEEDLDELAVNLTDLREILGSKLGQEIYLK